MISESGVKPKCSRALVFKWHEIFKNGRKSVEDNDRCGGERSIRSTLTTKMKEMVDAERRATVRGISADLGISASTVYNIPRLLILEEKEKRVEKLRR